MARDPNFLFRGLYFQEKLDASLSKRKKKSLYLDHYSICRWQVFIVNSHKHHRAVLNQITSLKAVSIHKR